MRRRHFLGRLAGLLAAGSSLPACAGDGRETDGAGIAAPLPATADGPAAEAPPSRVLGPSSLPSRPFGATGEVLPVLGLGGYHLGQCADESAARSLVEAALDAGVRFFDTAEQYQRGDDSRSERWLGAALESVRDQVFVMTKTWDPETRSAEGARRHLEDSLRRLRSDRLDLWQLHAIQSPEDVDRAFAPGGAMEAILTARDEGLVRFVGVTGHADPAAHRRALHHWDRGLRFDAVQLPINPIDHHQRSFQRQVLPELVRRGIAPIAMKTAASGALLEQGVCSIEECLRYVLGLPVALVVSGMEGPDQLRANAAAVAAGPLDAGQAEELLARIAPRAELELEWYKRA